MRNGEVSYWWQRHGIPPRRPSLPGGTDADVCIVGGGYTGLWTAYYLKRADPALRIVVLEASFAGFGASGRNYEDPGAGVRHVELELFDLIAGIQRRRRACRRCRQECHNGFNAVRQYQCDTIAARNACTL